MSAELKGKIVMPFLHQFFLSFLQSNSDSLPVVKVVRWVLLWWKNRETELDSLEDEQKSLEILVFSCCELVSSHSYASRSFLEIPFCICSYSIQRLKDTVNLKRISKRNVKSLVTRISLQHKSNTWLLFWNSFHSNVSEILHILFWHINTTQWTLFAYSMINCYVVPQNWVKRTSINGFKILLMLLLQLKNSWILSIQTSIAFVLLLLFSCSWEFIWIPRRELISDLSLFIYRKWLHQELQSQKELQNFSSQVWNKNGLKFQSKVHASIPTETNCIIDISME